MSGRSRMARRGQFIGAVLVATVALAGGVALGRQLAPGPVVRVQSTFPVTAPPDPAVLVQALLDFPVGTVVPSHTHGGAAYVTILAGEITVEGPDGARTYHAGETLVEQPGHVYAAFNSGDTPASLIVTYLVPAGAEVTTLVGK